MIIEKQISQNINIDPQIEKIILGVGPCRSGTTLLARIFSELGIDSWYQPFKSILRGFMHDNDVALNVNMANVNSILIKETLGPYTSNEAYLNGIKELLNSGVDKERINLISLIREPLEVCASSVLKFSQFEEREDIIDVCLMSYESIERINDFAVANNIKSISLAYEAWNRPDPLSVLEILLSKLDIPFDKHNFKNWKSLNSFDELPKLHWLYEPEKYHQVDFFEKVKKVNTISYFRKPENEINDILSNAQKDKIINSRVFEIYEKLKRKSEKDLGIKIKSNSF